MKLKMIENIFILITSITIIILIFSLGIFAVLMPQIKYCEQLGLEFESNKFLGISGTFMCSDMKVRTGYFEKICDTSCLRYDKWGNCVKENYTNCRYASVRRDKP